MKILTTIAKISVVVAAVIGTIFWGVLAASAAKLGWSAGAVACLSALVVIWGLALLILALYEEDGGWDDKD